MAESGSWPSILERGLLSTQALVDMYQPGEALRREILQQVRRRMVILHREGLPDAAVRDQLPLKFISQRLLPGDTLQDFLDALNSRVFFHVAEDRLHRLLGARAYRGAPHDVLICDTRKLLLAHDDVDLAPYNTGSVHVPNMPARGPSTFVHLEDYPWEYWRRKRGETDAVVELTIKHSALLESSILRVESWYDGKLASITFER
ncbi:hypothetical protein [Microbacterium sp. EST19A]|uniref:DUF7002 family protein n=1 Tax=Microbacterium sp. EST19A TaxID=2862681 RepID=UPI0035AB7318